MRRTAALLRNAKGYSWFQQYQKHGQDGFLKYTPPTPFDWTAELGEGKGPATRPRAVFTMRLEKEIIGDLVFELAKDIVPNTVENFSRLVKGEGAVFQGYKGTAFHLIRKGEVVMGGDVEAVEGSIGQGNHSAYQNRFIADENFIIPHTQRGLISMVSVGRDTNGSQFYIDLGAKNKHLNGKCVVFGRLIEGNNVLETIEQVFTVRSTPVRPIAIDACYILEPGSFTDKKK